MKCYASKIDKANIVKLTTVKLTIVCIANPNKSPYVSLLLELGRKPPTKAGEKKQVVIGSIAFSTAEVGQIPIAIVTLRPSDVLDPDYESIEAVDESFRGLVKAHYDPQLLIEGERNKLKSLKSMLRMC